jgi:hypothetical protein
MVDVTVTAASVIASGQAEKESGIAGAAITAGQSVYKEAATGQFKLTDVDSATAEVRNCYGVALNGAAIGQSVTVAKSDPDFTPGATLVKGSRYYASSTPGGVAPEADVTSGKYVVLLGVASSTSKLILRPWNTGVVV